MIYYMCALVFSPVFQIEDTVTRLRKQYVGNYSLQAKAGGTSQHNMIDFPPNTMYEKRE